MDHVETGRNEQLRVPPDASGTRGCAREPSGNGLRPLRRREAAWRSGADEAGAGRQSGGGTPPPLAAPNQLRTSCMAFDSSSTERGKRMLFSM